MRRLLTRIICVFTILFLMGMTVCAQDADNISNSIKKNKVFQVNSDVNLYEAPDESTTVTATLTAGTPVVIQEDAQDGWCKVSYQEKMGYVKITFIGILGSPILPSSEASQNVQAVEPTEANEAAAENDNASNVEAPDLESKTEGADATNDEGLPQSEPALENENVVNNPNALDDEFEAVKEQNQMAYQEAENAKKQAESEKKWGIIIAVLVISIFAVGITTALKGNKGKEKEQ